MVEFGKKLSLFCKYFIWTINDLIQFFFSYKKQKKQKKKFVFSFKSSKIVVVLFKKLDFISLIKDLILFFLSEFLKISFCLKISFLSVKDSIIYQ